jgi:transposase
MEGVMDVKFGVCAGIDVHQAEMSVCLRRVQSGGTAELTERRFSTMLDDIKKCSDWLAEEGCMAAVMESTGVYWRPVYHVLVQRIPEVLIANPADVRQRKGKKTDKADAKWLSELLAHGLVLPSFIPPREVVALRDLTRLRVTLVQQRASFKNRVYKVLEDANIKASSVMSAIFCKSGRNMLDHLVSGERDPDKLADLALGTLRKKLPELRRALEGHFTDHHAMMVEMLLQNIDLLGAQIARLEAEIEKASQVFASQLERLTTIPGIDKSAAVQIVAEIGVDMSRFGSAARLSSWAGLCPGNNESAGKRKSARTRKANKYLRRILVECAWAARQTRTSLGWKFARLRDRLGGKKAAVATGHKILIIVFNLLNEGTVFDEGRYGDLSKKQEERLKRNAVKTLEKMGFSVQLMTA